MTYEEFLRVVNSRYGLGGMSAAWVYRCASLGLIAKDDASLIVRSWT